MSVESNQKLLAKHPDSSSLEKSQLVEHEQNFKGKKSKAVVPAHMSSMNFNVNKFRTLPADGISASFLTTSNGKYDFRIDRHSYGKIKSATLEIKVSESGASNTITLAPCSWWFNEIQFLPNGGAQTQGVQRLYAMPEFAKLGFLDWNHYQPVSEAQNTYELSTLSETIPASGSRRYYIPLVGSFFDQCSPDGSHLSQDMVIRLYARGSVIASGSGSVTLNEMNLILEEEELTERDRMTHHKLYKSVPQRFNLLDWQEYEEAFTFTASTERRVSLETLSGYCPFLLVGLRSSVSVTSNAICDFADLGDYAQLDVENSAGRSLLGHGTKLQGKYLKKFVMPSHGCHPDLARRNLYVLPFCGSARDAVFGGVIDGGHYFVPNNNDYLCITPDVAKTDIVFSVNLTSAANDGGVAKISWGGEFSQDILFNATVATLKSAVEAFTFVKKEGWTVTFSGTMATDFTITVTGMRQEDVQKYGAPAVVQHTLNDGTVEDIVVGVSVTTYPTNGWAGNGTYTLSIYAPTWRTVNINPDGRITYEDVAE